MNFNAFLIKLDRCCGWILLFLMLAYIVSGYGSVKEIIDPIFAKYLHEILLPIPMFICFIIHVTINSRLAFIRWRLASIKWINFYIIILSSFLLLFFLWLYFMG